MPLKRPRSSDDLQMETQEDQEYFDSYADLSVHTLMLRDRPRMVAYTDALRNLAPLIQGKRVLDVGAGSGVLSMLCAKICSPAYVLAVEATVSTARLASSLVEANGLGDIVKVVNCRVEDVDDSAKFDVIISEWMGFYLFHEAMLDSVLWARDHLCVSSPLMLPSTCALYAHAWSADKIISERSVGAWSGYCDGLLDFSLLGQLDMQQAMTVPQVDCYSPDELLSDAACVVHVELTTVSASFLREQEIIRAPVSLHVNKNGNFAGVLFWFDCGFGPSSVKLVTSPADQATHWKQTGILLGCCAPVSPGTQIDLQVILSRDEYDSRQMTISIET